MPIYSRYGRARWRADFFGGGWCQKGRNYETRERHESDDRKDRIQRGELSGYRCLVMELTVQGIPFEEKPRLRLEYKGRPLKQEYEPDFLCFGEIILEIKAVKQLTDEHRAQVINST